MPASDSTEAQRHTLAKVFCAIGVNVDDYTNTFPLPATPTKWKYRGIYRVGDAQVGVWSNTVEITVGGKQNVCGSNH